MEKNQLISYKQKKNAEIELIKIRNLKFYSDNGIRYFIDWIYSTTPEEILNNKKDLIIQSTLDLKFQKKLESSVKTKISNIDENIQVAAIVMDYDGAIKALLGGRSWNKSKFNRATQSKRQLGSVFKTYVYLTALSMGYELTDKIQDIPFKKASWAPKNFSNKYEGIISIKRALQYLPMLQQ